ncbi:hypothetical protein [Corynebacterium auriscanis]|nr:hypothetical protein [Corynebacterium auriscanis]
MNRTTRDHSEHPHAISRLVPTEPPEALHRPYSVEEDFQALADTHA